MDEDLVTACIGRAEAEDCTVAGGSPGVCTGELCLLGGCGDGRINADNECDGSDLGGKTCLDFGSDEPEGLVCVNCQFDLSECRLRCGDGVINGEEECDGDLAGNTCRKFGFYEDEGLVCNAAGADRECRFNTADCRRYCGDGVVDVDDFEKCDREALAGTCASEGYFGAVTAPRCGPNCLYDAASCLCGGFRCAQGTEQCVDVGGGRLACEPCPKAGC